jgi:glycerol-3-phosphate acyltransferase PlsY
MAKGLLVVAIARWLGVPEIFVFIAGFAVVAGHIWPVFLGFKGGGGAATTLGVLLALVPREFTISFSIMVLIVLLTKNFGFAIGVGLAPLPLIIWGFGGESSLIIYSVALALFCAFKNIRGVMTFVHGLLTLSNKRDLIIDKRFRLWQRGGKR